MQDFSTTIINNLHNQQTWLDLFLKNLDPSLFQNVIIGILAIFIPVAIVLLEKYVKDGDVAFYKRALVLNEVMKFKQVFWISVIALVTFSFFVGSSDPNFDISNTAKIISIVLLFIFLTLLTIPLFNTIRFITGQQTRFKLSFFKHANKKQKSKLDEIARSWQDKWKEDAPDNSENEREFTKILISNIDGAIKHKKFDFAIELAQSYVANIEKRNRFLIGYEILPKIFEWNEILWNEQQLWLKGYDTEKRIQNLISQKHFPTFRSWVLSIYKKLNSKRDRFWNWHYFGGEFFQATIKVLLKDGHGPYQLFASFKKHIDESVEKLNKIEDKKEKDKYDHYITGLFASFCPTFFNEIDNAPSNYSIWEHDFPKEWKISMANAKSGIPRVILHEFLQWSRDRIFKKDGKKDFDKDLTEVINGIFPNIHSSLFTAFLMLFFSAEVKYALEKEPNFYILGTSVSWAGSAEESKEERDKRLAEMMREKETSQKEETIQIILNFFHFWQKLKIYKDDLSKEEFENWESFTEEKRKEIVKKVRKDKLEKLKAKIESDEVKKICKDDERKELYRKDFLELIKLLLQEI